MKDTGHIMVDVPICTYNHEKYLAHALDSVLMQKCNFEVRIFVGEDSSSDGTRDILKEYVAKYPEVIFPIFHSSNVGPAKNTKVLLKKCTAEYIAILDGDDYWTDPYKLQKQVNILAKYPDCVACHHWHKITVKDNEGNYVEKNAPKEAHGYNSKQIADVSEIFAFRLRPQTRTLMFRNIFKSEPLPDWFYKIKFGDIALSMILGKYGKFYFIDEEMAAYRVTGQGMSSMFSTKNGYIEGNKGWMRLLSFALKHHDYKYKNEAMEGLKFFIDRIKTKTNSSYLQGIKLANFIFSDLDLPSAIKRKLIYYTFT